MNRFIDLADHGGCSKKAGAGELRSLLKQIASTDGPHHLHPIADGFPDVGICKLTDVRAISTIDVVLPMVDDPRDFGQIAATHVLSDLYAGLADPAFALAILGVPKNMPADHQWIVQMLGAARSVLESSGATLVGGHTLADQEDLFLGFAAVGTPMDGVGMTHNRSVHPGDLLILTKPVGVGVATVRWKADASKSLQHSDVLASMKLSNYTAAKIAVKYGVRGCTDITGYGLLGHIHNLVFASGCSCLLEPSKVPIFKSISLLSDAECGFTRQFSKNQDYLSNYVSGDEYLSPLQALCFFDSEVSGGLLLAVKPNVREDMISELKLNGHSAECIGEVKKGQSGHVILKHTACQ
jgi:selenide, water dikinase